MVQDSEVSLNSGNAGNRNSGTENGGIDPLFISSSDNPNSSLVVTIFSGNNFMRWSRNDKDFQKWKRADYMVMSWILNSMSPELADEFGFIENSTDLWSELQERFGQSNGPLVYQLKKEISDLKQENLSIVAYYGKVKKLWDELQSLKMFPICSCGALNSCSCNFLKKLQDLEAEDKLMQFLLGLNSGFNSTISNLLSMDPMPTINRAFSIVQQIEKQQEVSAGVVEIGAESSAMAAQRNYKAAQSQKIFFNPMKRDWRKDKMDKFCDHCKNKGHSIDQCFKLIGYPEWYNTIKAGKKGGQNVHKIVANVHTANQDTPLDTHDNQHETHNTYTGIDSDMLAVICQQVMKNMKGKQMTSDEGASSSFASFAGNNSITCSVFKSQEHVNWIIDSGACDHMVYDINMLV
ncbi:uncharacterized protein LOC109134327 [Beta vulgaris subsp. vulgaris]|uniref:uncharacterized protein LOC109134327 n=1 Tax=Beta vulgaris subsp. vulgaris TaxID=3555 RepID=UPI00203671C6|nr:uncharacterized protein LOC109134327 [Beta vulgaris subsp. vulgaris]